MDEGRKKGAQFVEMPPLEMVTEFFTTVTGLPLQLDVSWTRWIAYDVDELYVFKPYIRKCHQKLLLETANGVQKNVCSFLRQLLRPYGYCIVLSKGIYSLCENKDESKTVGKKDGKVVVWEE